MAASTWCRFRSILNGIKILKVNQTGAYCSSMSTVVNQGDASRKEKMEYPEFEVSTEEFKHVERLMPVEIVPDPPNHSSFPTPSGWVPPAEPTESPHYFVQRTRNHMLPVYLQTTHGGTRKLVMIRKVEGDIWAFEAELRAHLENLKGKKIVTQVHEVGRFVRVKGLVQDDVADFLLEKGF